MRDDEELREVAECLPRDFAAEMTTLLHLALALSVRYSGGTALPDEQISAIRSGLASLSPKDLQSAIGFYRYHLRLCAVAAVVDAVEAKMVKKGADVAGVAGGPIVLKCREGKLSMKRDRSGRTWQEVAETISRDATAVMGSTLGLAIAEAIKTGTEPKIQEADRVENADVADMIRMVLRILPPGELDEAILFYRYHLKLCGFDERKTN